MKVEMYSPVDNISIPAWIVYVHDIQSSEVREERYIPAMARFKPQSCFVLLYSSILLHCMDTKVYIMFILCSLLLFGLARIHFPDFPEQHFIRVVFSP